MYLSPDPKNRVDSTVMEIQNKLNSIRSYFHHNWPYLTVDGIYGKDTAAAVKGFQVYKGITSAPAPLGPILGDTTIQNIRQEFLRIPGFSSVTSTPSVVKETKPFNLMDFTNLFMDILMGYTDFITKEIEYIATQKTINPNALKQRYYSMIFRQDKRMILLKKHLREYSEKNSDKAFHNKNAKRNNKKLMQELKKYNIAEKLNKKIEKHMPKIKMETMKGTKAFKPKVTIGGLFKIWSFKDVIWDLLQFQKYGTQEWQDKLYKDFTDFLDGFVIGYACAIIAEVFVAGLVAAGVALGYTAPAWIPVVLAVIIAVGLGCMISYLMDEAEVSFSDTAMRAYSDFILVIAGAKN